MLPGTFPSVRPTKCGSFPTPSQQHVRRRPQRQVSITYSDEVPQVKVENRERLLLSHGRAYAHVSLFPFFAFTSSPTCRKTMIHRSIGVKALLKSLHILLISRGFFFDNPLFSNTLPLISTKKMGNSINVCDRQNHCAVCFFRARVRSAPQCTALSFTAGCEAHFYRSVLDSAWQTARISTSKRGEVAVTALLHGRTRKREPQSAKPSHLSNYESTPCAIRVKR